MSTRTRRGAAAVALMVSAILVAGPAWAHGGDETTNGGDLVRQAIALMVNEPKNRMAAEEKIDDALRTTDTEGVNIEVVKEAKTTLDAGNVHRARALLEVSIGARPHITDAEVLPIPQTAGPPSGPEVSALVTGAQSGTNVAIDALRPRRRFDAGTWLALAAAAVAILGGVALAVRYRPSVSVRSLRREVAVADSGEEAS